MMNICQRKTISKSVRFVILSKQNYNCGNIDCKVPCLTGRPFQIDHRVALCLGGSDEKRNLQVLCYECHAIKTIEDVSEYHRRKSLQRIAKCAHDIVCCMQSMINGFNEVSNAEEVAPKVKSTIDRFIPLRECDQYIQDKWRRKIVDIGNFDSVCEEPSIFVDNIMNKLWYCNDKKRKRNDNYFYAMGVGRMRSAFDICESFLKISHLDTSGVKKRRMTQAA